MTLPGVKNKLKITEIISNKNKDFSPLVINSNGTLDFLITNDKNMIAIIYPIILLAIKIVIKKAKVPANFTLASSE